MNRWRPGRRRRSSGPGLLRSIGPELVSAASDNDPTNVGTAVTLAGISVIGMLVAASVLGGFGTPIGLVLLVRLARDPQVMGPQPISRRLAIAGWVVAVLVGGFGLLAILGAALGTF